MESKTERRKAAAAAANGAQRRPLAPSEKNNAAAAATPAGRRTEGPSRSKPVAPPPSTPTPTPAPAPAAPAPRRCRSPSPGRRASPSPADGGGSAATCNNNRARSADRARPAAAAAAAAPSSPAPSTSSRPKPSAAAASRFAMSPPRHGTAVDGHGAIARARNAIAKASHGLWASTRRRSSSFPLRWGRSETTTEPVQVPSPVVSKVDRLVHGLPSSQQAKQLSPGAVAERKKSPHRRSTNNTGDHQCENARPLESPANSVAAEKQHRWPGMMAGRGSSGLASTTTSPAEAEKPSSSRSVSVSSSDASAGRSARSTQTHPSEGTTGKISLRRPPNGMAAKIAHRRRKDKAADSSSSSDTSSQTSGSYKKSTCCRQNKSACASSPVAALHRSSSSPRPGLSSAASSSTSSRPCRSPSRPSAPAPGCRSKCASSAAHSGVEQPAFSYIVDARKGKKKSAGQLENIHRLRLLSNRYLQWRFVNARSEETLSHKSSVESILHSVWKSILTLRDALTITTTNVRHLQQEQKLYGILTEQIGYLEQWPLLEEECNDTLAEATEALTASTLRLPVTSGAHADEISVRNAISSAVDVMQTLSSSIHYLQSKVEDRTSVVSELSVMEGHEKVALDQCRELLATAAKLQVQETSLRTHLMQLRLRSAG